MDALYVTYTGVNTTYIPITSGQTLDVILRNIDTAFNETTAAPDYTGYSLACVTQTDGSSHPTNTQNFAEGISKILCDFKTAYTTFTTSTYVTNQGVITTAINGLQDPEYTYAPFSITDADGIDTVWSKTFTGLTAITESIDPYDADWAELSITPSHSVVDTWDNVITYLSALATTVAGKQATIGTFNNSANCLAGGATDSIATTVGLLTTYVCTLPEYDPDEPTWGCVTAGTDLQTSINNIVASLSGTMNTYMNAVGTGLTLTSASCSGRTVAIDTDWVGLYKAAATSTAAAAGDYDYLEDVIISTDGSITIDASTDNSKIDLSVTNPLDGKAKVETGGTSGFLSDKITATIGDWGLSINASVTADQLVLTPTILYPAVFIQNFITECSNNAELLAQFCALVQQCSGCQCAAPTGFTVVVTTV